ncbi:hypothetical protein RB195_011490 [Necator americanus]|uniref:Uncharacterized protein n=1 Tax=Necator americanus TaxID=51031 RepID=A0ABR1D2M1_NECAM
MRNRWPPSLRKSADIKSVPGLETVVGLHQLKGLGLAQELTEGKCLSRSSAQRFLSHYEKSGSLVIFKIRTRLLVCCFEALSAQGSWNFKAVKQLLSLGDPSMSAGSHRSSAPDSPLRQYESISLSALYLETVTPRNYLQLPDTDTLDAAQCVDLIRLGYSVWTVCSCIVHLERRRGLAWKEGEFDGVSTASKPGIIFKPVKISSCQIEARAKIVNKLYDG